MSIYHIYDNGSERYVSSQQLKKGSRIYAFRSPFSQDRRPIIPSFRQKVLVIYLRRVPAPALDLPNGQYPFEWVKFLVEVGVRSEKKEMGKLGVLNFELKLLRQICLYVEGNDLSSKRGVIDQ